jgi:hypothetical protein
VVQQGCFDQIGDHKVVFSDQDFQHTTHR